MRSHPSTLRSLRSLPSTARSSGPLRFDEVPMRRAPKYVSILLGLAEISCGDTPSTVTNQQASEGDDRGDGDSSGDGDDSNEGDSDRGDGDGDADDNFD